MHALGIALYTDKNMKLSHFISGLPISRLSRRAIPKPNPRPEIPRRLVRRRFHFIQTSIPKANRQKGQNLRLSQSSGQREIRETHGDRQTIWDKDLRRFGSFRL